MPEDAITGTDLAHVVDLVGALWDEHDAYTWTLLVHLGQRRGMAAAVGLCCYLLEREAEHRGVTRDQVLGLVRGEVQGS